eukprot:9351553-Pyramimonas_sp.AAC.1
MGYHKGTKTHGESDSDDSRESSDERRNSRGNRKRLEKGTGGTCARRGASSASESEGGRSHGAPELCAVKTKESEVDESATRTGGTSAKTAGRQDTVAAAAAATTKESEEWHTVKQKRKNATLKFTKNKKGSPPNEAPVPTEVESVVPAFDDRKHDDTT